ncbi:diguanylate cyclase domain-containing protein [Qipengyuania nanhaisediminis]|uniref:diguanylate cyclase domain-containing protein n=1 Tax=Qipengyuania nanhaisediminis TaxID=604088 RepID=UPI0038B3AB90
MTLQFSGAEARVLRGLLEDVSGDIVVRLDADGFIVHATENAHVLGLDLSTLLLMPHVADFADAGSAAQVHEYVNAVFAGEPEAGWIEFPLAMPPEPGEGEAPAGLALPKAQAPQPWFALNLRLVEPDDGAPQGALGLIRSVQERADRRPHPGDGQAIDPSTGLITRNALRADLRQAISRGREPVAAIFAVDRMRAMFMQYGQRTVDEIQWGFGRFLKSMEQPGQRLAQIDGERFAMLLPGMSLGEARGWAGEVLHTFAGLSDPSSSRAPELTASAGLARGEVSEDWTLRQAELGLVMARAGGGMRVGLGRKRAPSRHAELSCSRRVERAVNEAVMRAVQNRS